MEIIYPQRQLSLGSIVRGEIIREAIFLGSNCPDIMRRVCIYKSSFVVLVTFKIPSTISFIYCLILKLFRERFCFPQKRNHNSIQFLFFYTLSQCPGWIHPGERPGKNLVCKTAPHWNKFEFPTSTMHIT